MSDRKPPPRVADVAPEFAPCPEGWGECWCDDACRYLDMMLDRREEERRLEEAAPGRDPGR